MVTAVGLTAKLGKQAAAKRKAASVAIQQQLPGFLQSGAALLSILRGKRGISVRCDPHATAVAARTRYFLK
jgi:hypothetical protein